VNIVRVFQDGDFVFAHTLSGIKIEFHIFRFEDGYMVEHWDNFQEAIMPTKSGNSMIDGPTQSRDLDKTDENKKLIKKFLDDVLYAHNIKNIANYISTEKYVQHNPRVADGLAGFSAAMEALAKAGLKLEYTKTYKILGEGDFVLTQSEGELAGQAVAFYDLWRVENGKITEHWDVLEPMMPKEKWKNQNGKF
jgi:predicted SnoaL-like aldol condensation-catalyzing enzyme